MSAAFSPIMIDGALVLPDVSVGMIEASMGTDVVLENYGPGTMERLGCGYEQLARLNPRLVMSSWRGSTPRALAANATSVPPEIRFAKLRSALRRHR